MTENNRETIIYTDVDIHRIGTPWAFEIENMIFQLFRKKNLQEILAFGHQLLGNFPHLVIGGTLAAYTSNSPFSNSSFLDMLRGTAPEAREPLFLLTKEEFLQKQQSSSTPLLVECRHLDLRLIISKIVNHGKTVACLMLPESEQQFGKDDVIYMHILARYLSLELGQGMEGKDIRSILIDTNFKALLDKQRVEPSDHDWLSLLLATGKNAVLRITVIKPLCENLKQLSQILLVELNYTRIVEYNGILVGLAMLRDHVEHELFLTSLNELSKKHQFCVGLSEEFYDVERILLSFRQAYVCLEAGETNFPTKRVYDYTTMKMDTVLHEAVHHLGSRKYIHPVFDRLKKDDLLNGSVLYETLQTYLQLGGDKAAVSRQLSIHKNTLAFRMYCIQQTYGLEFIGNDNLYQLLFNLKLSCLQNKKSGGNHDESNK